MSPKDPIVSPAPKAIHTPRSSRSLIARARQSRPAPSSSPAYMSPSSGVPKTSLVPIAPVTVRTA